MHLYERPHGPVDCEKCGCRCSFWIPVGASLLALEGAVLVVDNTLRCPCIFIFTWRPQVLGISPEGPRSEQKVSGVQRNSWICIVSTLFALQTVIFSIRQRIHCTLSTDTNSCPFRRKLVQTKNLWVLQRLFEERWTSCTRKNNYVICYNLRNLVHGIAGFYTPKVYNLYSFAEPGVFFTTLSHYVITLPRPVLRLQVRNHQQWKSLDFSALPMPLPQSWCAFARAAMTA